MKETDDPGAVADNSYHRNRCIQSLDPKPCYEIRFKGHLDDHWAARFHGCSLSREESGTTSMVCPVTDQAELFGFLNKVRDLSLPLISVNPVIPQSPPNFREK